MPESEKPASRKFTADAWVGAAAYVATAVAFWPVSRWIIHATEARDQIRQSLVILAFVGVLLFFTDRRRFRFAPKLDAVNLILLAGAYVFAVATSLSGFTPLILIGFLLFVTSATRFVFGPRYFHLFKWLIVGFAVFLGLIVLFPVVDWPLRKLAGIEAAHMLQWIGWTPHLLVRESPTLQLILNVNGRSFEVATKCNGFGLISSGTLLALLLALASRTPILWKIGVTAYAAVLGFFINALRILSITLLAPSFPNHYQTMHDTLGVIASFVGLGLIWWVAYLPDSFGPKPDESKSAGAKARADT